MRLTTKGRFAVTAMLDLALYEQAPAAERRLPVTLSAIAERQGISLSYLEQLFGKLRRKNIVDSVRGPGGGYVLASALNAISVADIIAAVDEEVDATMCGGKEDCHSGETSGHVAHRIGGGTLPGAVGKCMTHDLWANLNQKVHDYLDSVSLADLVRQTREREAGISTISASILFTQHSQHLSKPTTSAALGA